MVLIGVFVTHAVSGFSLFEAVNGVLTEYGHHPIQEWSFDFFFNSALVALELRAAVMVFTICQALLSVNG
jgi:hypothetical protein